MITLMQIAVLIRFVHPAWYVRHKDDIMQYKVDNIFYVTEVDGLPHLETGGELVSQGRGRQLWANQRAEITHGVGDKRGVKRCPGSFQYMAR